MAASARASQSVRAALHGKCLLHSARAPWPLVTHLFWVKTFLESVGWLSVVAGLNHTSGDVALRSIATLRPKGGSSDGLCQRFLPALTAPLPCSPPTAHYAAV